MSKDNEGLTAKDVYSDISNNYRFFLNWRHALLGGYIAALFAIFSAISWMMENNHQDQLWIIYLFGIIVSLFFWGFEYRVRDLYKVCIDCGAALEKKSGYSGIYTRFQDTKTWNKFITHSRIINLFFLSAITIMLAMLIVT
jgi:hypothetical protein